MYTILDLNRVFSTFQETVWSLLNMVVHHAPVCREADSYDESLCTFLTWLCFPSDTACFCWLVSVWIFHMLCIVKAFVFDSLWSLLSCLWQLFTYPLYLHRTGSCYCFYPLRRPNFLLLMFHSPEILSISTFFSSLWIRFLSCCFLYFSVLLSVLLYPSTHSSHAVARRSRCTIHIYI